MARKLKTDTKDDDLSLVVAQFSDSEDTTITERAEAELHRAYYDGHQWSSDEIAALEARKQPVITDNKLRDKVEFLLGLERKTRTDPKAYPRNPQTDEASAEAATDALRYVCDDNQFQFVRSNVAEAMFIEGRGGVEIVIEKKGARKSPGGGLIPRIVVREIRWDRGYVDPHSMRLDYSDASYKGYLTWMDYSAAKMRWPNKVDVLDACFTHSEVQADTYDDKPRFVINKAGRKRVQVFSHYFLKGGVWHYCEFVKGGFLVEPAPSQYLDENGEPECCLEFQAMYREGKTGRAYGVVRRYKDLQDDWNKRRSKSLHLLNVNQIVMEDGAAGSDEEAIANLRKEAARPDGVIQHIPGTSLEVRNGLDLAQGHIQLMMLTGQSLDAAGPNDALTGVSGSISGRAKQIDQQAGVVAIDKPFDAIRHLTLRVYRHIWNRVRQYWTEETFIRVRDEDHMKFVALNRPRMRGEVVAEQLQKEQMPDEEKAALLEQIAADPNMRLPVVTNAVGELDVDIVIDEAPDVVTLQQEQFGTLAELAKSGVPIPPKALVEASALRNKRQILDAMGGGDDPVAQQMAQLEMRLKNLEALDIEARIRKTMSEVAKNEATATESQVDASVKVAQFTNGPEPAETQVRVS